MVSFCKCFFSIDDIVLTPLDSKMLQGLCDEKQSCLGEISLVPFQQRNIPFG